MPRAILSPAVIAKEFLRVLKYVLIPHARCPIYYVEHIDMAPIPQNGWHQLVINFQVDTQVFLMDVDYFGNRVLRPAVESLAHEIQRRWPPNSTMYTADLPVRGMIGAEFARSVDPASGLSIRLTMSRDLLSGDYLLRAEMLCAFENCYQLTAEDANLLDLLSQAKAALAEQLERSRQWVA